MAELAERSATTIQDLRDWLQAVETAGELRRITQPVDWNEEMGAITYLVGKQEDAPALLFENIAGYGADRSALWNLLGNSLNRIGLALGAGTGLSATEMIVWMRDRLKQPLPPVAVDPGTAPLNENVQQGDAIDLLAFPAAKQWPFDGGRYLGTADVVLTRNPDTGVVNLGTYRMMVQGRNQLGLYLSPGKDARLHLARAWQLDQPLEVAAVVGVDPLLFIVGSQTFPKSLSEYDFAGALRGTPVATVPGLTVDLPVPARAEIVIEGLARPNHTRMEGPFGEFTGYYGRPEAETPLIEVTAIRHRHQPILTNALMSDYPSCEMALFYAIAKSARIWDDLDRLGIPGIKGVYAHPAAASGFGMVTVSLEQRYAGHAPQVLALAAQCPGAAYYTKWIVAVDEDVDPTNINEVLWALATRCNPVEDIDLLRNTWSTWLDPTQNPPEERPWGSKALINACREHRYLGVFSQRSTVRRSAYERIAARWGELGLPGTPPTLRAFAEDGQGPAFHEAQQRTRAMVDPGDSPDPRT